MTLAAINWNLLFEDPELVRVFRVVVVILLGLGLLYGITLALGRVLRENASPHFSLLVKKLVFYLGSVVIILTVLLELGFDLRGLLATAGIATVAIGFAAQTSLSNLISGLFLIGEKPFRIGDLVRVNEVTGIVESIDLLSIKIRTLDNLFVRIPNESMIKNPMTNITRYPIRRMDLTIGVAYREDVARVMEILKELAAANPLALDDPEPLILFNDFGESSLQFRFGLWFEKSNFLKLRNSILREIKERFDREGIEIPFPHVTLYSGSESGPFSVKLEEGKASKP
ncbi:MAG: mechanosensitive ion channel family protein [Oceanipulchritudo sp.]